MRKLQDVRTQHLGGGYEEIAVVVIAEMDVAGDYALDVEGAARPLVVLQGLVAVARVDLGMGTNRTPARGEVNLVLVLVENVADLLARKRLNAALGERSGRRRVGGEADAAADIVQCDLADAVLGESADEGVLDGKHLVVRDRLVVVVPGTDMVVDLAERRFTRQSDLAGVELAGSDLLELLDRDVHPREIDWIGHFSDSFICL